MPSEKQAFERIVRKTFEELYRFALCLGGEEEAAAELVRQTFRARAGTSAPLAETEESLLWLYTTLYRLFIAQAAEEPVPATEARNDDDLDNYLLLECPSDKVNELEPQAVLEAFWQIPPGQRPALALHYLGKRSYKEIARIVDATPETAMKRVARGKRAFRRALAAKIAARSRRILASETNNDPL